MFLKPFTKILKEEFLNSYNIKIENSYEYGQFLNIPFLNCNIFFLYFPKFVTTINNDPNKEEGKINLTFLEKLYLWSAIRDKFLEIQMIKNFNKNAL